MSGTAKITINEVDNTQRVSGQSEAFVAGVIPAIKGDLEPVLVVNNTDFYKRYTPEAKFKAGYDLSYIEIEKFLNDNSNLYLNRAYNAPAYSATRIYQDVSTKTNSIVEYSLSNIDNFIFTTNNGRPFVGQSTVSIISADNKLQVSAIFFEKCLTGDVVRFTKDSADVFPPEILEATDFYIIKLDSNFIQIASSKVLALAGTFLTLTDNGTGTSFKIIDNTVQLDSQINQPLVLIYSCNPGDWANLIEIKTVSYETDKILVKEPGCFYLEVFYKGVSTGESFICSFDKNKKSKYGSSMYIEEVLKGSFYIRAKVNPMATDSLKIKENSTINLSLDLGVSDSSISESDLIKALQSFRNTKKYNIQFLCDFGITVPGFQKEIIDICESRGDCAFILSVPFDAQYSSSYLSEILDYKNQTLNSISNYGAIYVGHCKVSDSQLGRDLWISPSALVASKAVKVWDSGLVWDIIANTKADLSVLDVYRHFEETEESVLVDNGINPIRYEYGEGIKVWGERTLQIAPTAFDRLHVRLLYNYIKPALKKAYKPFLFQLNNIEDAESTWSTMKDIGDSFLNDLKARGGIYGYEIVVDSTNNSKQDIINSQVNIECYITPAYGIEKIRINLIANNNFINVSI